MKEYAYFIRYTARCHGIPPVHGNAELIVGQKISRVTDFGSFKKTVVDRIVREFGLKKSPSFESVTIDFYQLLRVEEVDEEKT